MVEDDDERNFRRMMHYDILDCVIAGLSSRFNAVHDIHKLFNFLCNYKSRTEIGLCHRATAFAVRYSADVSSDELVEEIKNLKAIHDAILLQILLDRSCC